MKIQYCSDLHLEFEENCRFVNKFPIIPKGEILIMAGDIMKFSMMKPHSGFIDFVSDQFEMVYWLPGNHEYYGSDIADKYVFLNERIRENVFLVNNLSVNLKEVELIFSTLWTKISTDNEEHIRGSLNDFFTIRKDGKPLTPLDYNLVHDESLYFVKKNVENETLNKRIVITHHIPTLLNYPEQYIGDKLNEAFAVELHDLIEKAYVDYWIYGHHHCNVPEFIIGKTKLVTNQLGYVHRNEHRFFKHDAVIEINN